MRRRTTANMWEIKAAFTRDLLEPFHMELIGTAWNGSHCMPFTRDWFQKVPRALLNRKCFSKQIHRHCSDYCCGCCCFMLMVAERGTVRPRGKEAS